MSSSTAENGKAALRSLPSVDELMRSATASALAESLGHARLASLSRSVIDVLRSDLLNGKASGIAATKLALLAEAESRLNAEWNRASSSGLRRVINATGVVIHTNLGRAPLSIGARARVAEAAGYCNVEYDLLTGKRGRRGARAEELLCEFSGAEAAVVVNNCAAAALLVLSVLAEGREVVISRGELVEIGGDFRVPDVLARSGAILREVGTTNRTKISDYEKAVNENTGLILRVHPSNFRVVGFTAAPDISELANLARDRGLILVEDAGSGAAEAIREFGFVDEPMISESIAAGVDIVIISGDKLLGGPQSGLIVGRKELIDKVRRHPLYRSLRVDKLIYATLEATLESHFRGTALEEIPVLRMLSATSEEIGTRTQLFLDKMRATSGDNGRLEFDIAEGNSAVGGGAAPTVQPETALLMLSHNAKSSAELEQILRLSDPPVIARIINDKVAIDLRTVSDSEEDDLLSVLVDIDRINDQEARPQ
jgi:L-seryl-tRNA(Ser) seleniumtransferase